MMQKMSDLPASHLRGMSMPFQHVGLDYSGPFAVLVASNRLEKRYVCLFTCLHMCVLHLEVTHGLETDSCVMALYCFQTR